MSNNQNPNKEQLLRTIERLERNPDDKVGILADVGITALGAAGAGAAAAFFGTTTASIPIITALTGIGMVVAAPVGLVAGAAVAGGAAIYSISRLIKDGGFHEGKRNQLLHEYREKLKEVEAKERCSDVKENDITDFYLFLKEPLKFNLITAEDAYQLIQSVEHGQIPLSEAYKLVGQLFDDESLKDTKIITMCQNCSQKLRVPSNLGILTLTCPKCKSSWQWVPK